MGYEECFRIMMENPDYAVRLRLDATAQHIMWDRARRHFLKDADRYLALLDEAENQGPGKLEMNAKLEYPHSTLHEIHSQPGGFVGDPLGGWVYHYAVTQGFRQGSAFHDENHIEYAMSYQKPADGVVRRCLDLGCGTGQSTTPIKMRFPDAEVWGVEVGGPLVRYAHYRAREMGLEVNFRHGLAEDNKFPDNYFDMASSSILFHEVSTEAAKKIVAETFRVLRPGGTYSHSDFVTEGHGNGRAHTLPGKAQLWRTRRHNAYEPWFIEYADSDLPGMLRAVGFTVDMSGTGVMGRPRVIATKPA
jgi:SAM-dependent methyltransferase